MKAKELKMNKQGIDLWKGDQKKASLAPSKSLATVLGRSRRIWHLDKNTPREPDSDTTQSVRVMDSGAAGE